MAISGTVGRLNLSGVKVELIPSGSVFARVSSPFLLKVTNSGRFLPRFLLSVKTDFSEKVTFFVVPPGRSARKSVCVVFPERGRISGLAGELRSPFPFRFFYRWKRTKVAVDCLVYPEPINCIVSESKEELEGVKEGFRRGEDELVRIREYFPGDDPRKIHWKLYAKREKLFSREFSRQENAFVMIDVDSLAGSIEEKLSCATYLVLQAFRKGVPVGLKAGRVYISPSADFYSRRRILEVLALYGKEEDEG
ncbi:DUF58 domain-containing protein [Desulfurobacterium sp.]